MAIDHTQTHEILKRINAQAASQLNQNVILQRIAEEKSSRILEAEAVAKVDKKLSEVEREYLEAIKAQEIMDQIDENRKKYV